MTNDNSIDDFLAAIEQGQWGTFPFGQPNLQRPPTAPSNTTRPVLAVLGVYPSAFHLSWRAPGAPDGKATIAALAVDVEPTVFWAGDDAADRAERIEAWKTATHDDGTHGDFGWAAFNGSSGSGFAKNYLEPLGVSYEQCFLTDCVPFYFVKSGKGEQGNAIDERWRPRAVERGWQDGDLPARPSTKTLVDLASHPARGLAKELASAQPTAIVTLGQEAADTLGAVCNAEAPVDVQLRAGDPEYGTPRRITLDGREVKWIPLAHPGATGRKGPWRDHHDAWRTTVPALLEK